MVILALATLALAQGGGIEGSRRAARLRLHARRPRQASRRTL